MGAVTSSSPLHLLGSFLSVQLVLISVAIVREPPRFFRSRPLFDFQTKIFKRCKGTSFDEVSTASLIRSWCQQIVSWYNLKYCIVLWFYKNFKRICNVQDTVTFWRYIDDELIYFKSLVAFSKSHIIFVYKPTTFQQFFIETWRKKQHIYSFYISAHVIVLSSLVYIFGTTFKMWPGSFDNCPSTTSSFGASKMFGTIKFTRRRFRKWTGFNN